MPTIPGNWLRCPDCGGEGRIETLVRLDYDGYQGYKFRPCERCEGVGYVPPEPPEDEEEEE